METTITTDNLQSVAEGFGLRNAVIKPLGNGLIHATFLARDDKRSIVLQQINTKVFADPQALIGNYRQLYHFLQQKGGVRIPEPIEAVNGNWLLKDGNGKIWRATAFIENSYSPEATESAEAAYTTAYSFATFTRMLSGMDLSKLHVLLADFHDLAYRYQQFEDTVAGMQGLRLMRATHVIAELRQRKSLVDFYVSVRNNPAYPLRLMHHDCKINNILFDLDTGQVICPIDLDTIMPGKYFSDLGDMIRTMACTVDENSREWEAIDIKPAFYHAIIKGYLDGIGSDFTGEEQENIHKSGLLLVFMQALRFVTDFLQGDTYYKTTYPEQNLNRALNQLVLLEKLEDFLEREMDGK